MGSNGPNISSVMIAASSGGSNKIVGSINLKCLNNIRHPNQCKTVAKETVMKESRELTDFVCRMNHHKQLKLRHQGPQEDCKPFQNDSCLQFYRYYSSFLCFPHKMF